MILAATEQSDGVQLEVVARRHEASDPDRTHAVELPPAVRAALGKALHKAYEAALKHDEASP